MISFAGQAQAAAVKVYSPYIEKGEVEIEYKGYRTFDSDSTKDNTQKNSVSLGYGVTDFWATEIGGAWKKSPGGSTLFDATEWENRFQLTERGEYFVDWGLLVEYEHVRDRRNDADEFAIGPIIAKDIGKTTNIVNVIFERQLGANRDGGVGVTYRFQSRWRLDPAFEPAIEAFGELGPVNNLNSPNAQEHLLGPAIQGAIQVPALGGKIKYNVGYLFGLTSESPQGMLKTVLEYELRF